MKKKEISSFQSHLLNWYTKNHRRLPWRETDDPYRIWISEVMLQQTQVKTVLPYYKRFCEHFPDVKSLAFASEQSILKLWEGLGYYARARNLHRSAGMILEKFNGTIPDNLPQIKQLPGVGDYIAAAVLSIVYHQVIPVVDGNVKRVLARLYCSNQPVNIHASYTHYQDLAVTLIDPLHPGLFNQAMMELGAVVCKPKHPDCTLCPVCSFCMAHKGNRVVDYPKRIPSRITPLHYIVVGVVFKKDYLLITRRKSEGLLGGLWEFPGGKVLPGEGAENACIREIKEEVGLDVGIFSYLTRVKHAYTHFRIVMDVFLCTFLRGNIRLNGPVDYRWIRIEEIDSFPFPKANHKFIPLLKKQKTPVF